MQKQIHSRASDRKDKERIRTMGRDKKLGNGEKEYLGKGNSVEQGAGNEFFLCSFLDG